MIKDKTKKYLSWAAVLVWMAIIFLLSAQTNKQSGSLSGGIVSRFVALLYQGFDSFPLDRQNEIVELWQRLIRKGAHFTEYAILAMLVANALRSCGKLRWYLPVVISALYAVTDEVHQYFVPGRACRLSDMGIDTCGAIFGVAVFALGLSILKKIKNPTP